MASDVRIGVIPGDGVVLRVDETVVVLGSPVSSPEYVERVATAVRTLAGDDLVRALARIALSADEPPAMAVATWGDEVVSVFLHGSIELRSPSARVTGADHVLGVTTAVARNAGFTIAPVGHDELRVASWSDLVAGTLPGVGVAVTPADGVDDAGGDAETPDDAARPDGTGWSPPATTPVAEPESIAVDSPFVSISLSVGADLSDRRPLPIATSSSTTTDDGATVAGTGPGGEPDGATPGSDDGPAYERPVTVMGVYSPRGFFNHPDAKYCSRTGVKMGASMTAVLTAGPRPPLGVLTLDDGSTLTVRWNTVIGRDPYIDELVRAGTAAPFVVSDLAQSVSRRHALLELVDWDVLISDLGSRNSTYLQEGPGEPLRQLAPGERVVLHSGTTVHVGKRSFVYHEHHVR